MPEWPVYQAEGYQQIFMYDHNERLRWIPNTETLKAYGYTAEDAEIVPISWFYDKSIVESIRDAKTQQCYPPEGTPHYQDYRRLKPDWEKVNKEVGQLEEQVLDVDKKAIEIQKKIEEMKAILG